jgi:5-methyltetrahydropteroyltriglutamate--homocysteine methyltransferase
MAAGSDFAAMKRLQRIRTDVVGSLLRPDGWKAARRAFEQGSTSAQQLRDIEDREIAAALAMQENVGLDVVTDGEMRRLNFQDSFGSSVSGYETAGEPTLAEAEKRVAAGGHRGRPDQGGVGSPVARRAFVVEPLRLSRNVPLEEYRFASARTNKPVKVTLIGPDRVVQRFDGERSRAVYPTVEGFLQDVVDIERRMVGSLVDAGSM